MTSHDPYFKMISASWGIILSYFCWGNQDPSRACFGGRHGNYAHGWNDPCPLQTLFSLPHVAAMRSGRAHNPPTPPNPRALSSRGTD